MLYQVSQMCFSKISNRGSCALYRNPIFAVSFTGLFKKGSADSMSIEFLYRIGKFSSEDLALFNEKAVLREIQKGRLLLQQGQVCQSVFFLVEGAFIQYNYIDEVEENIIDLHLEGEWMLNAQSFAGQAPSDTILQAYTDSKVYELHVHKLHELIARSQAFLQLGKLLGSDGMRTHFFDNRLSPVEKYEYLLNTRSQLLKVFPLKMIASYLKMSPETLSRVREKLAKERKLS